MIAYPAYSPSHVTNARDRCDRCSARASLIAVLHSGAGSLLFCGHHARVHRPVLERIAYCHEDPASRPLVTAA